MTLIGAKQLDDKRTLFTDDAVTVGQHRISAALQYRPKLREIKCGDYNLIIASCGSTKDIDLVTNFLEAKLIISEVTNTLELKTALQTALIKAMKSLKEVTNDIQVTLLILEPETNTLFVAEEYAVFQPQNEAELVFGSAEQAFYNLSELNAFIPAFFKAVESDEYCQFPVYVYRDGEMFEFDNRDSVDEIIDVLIPNEEENDGEEKIVGGRAIGEISRLWGRSGLSSPETKSIGQNPGEYYNEDGEDGEADEGDV